MTKSTPYLLTAETEKCLFQETLLPYFLRGESVSVMWVRHAGRRRTGRYLVQYSDAFGFQALKKYQTVIVPHGELVEETPQGFFQLMLNCLAPEAGQNSEEAFSILEKKISDLCEDDYHLIFILERFDEINDDSKFPPAFFNNLHTLWQIDKSRVHFLFCVATNLLKSENFNKLGHFKEVVFQNLVYFPLLQEKDSEATIDYLIDRYGYKVSTKQRSLIKKICGGHASLIRAAMRILQNFYSFDYQKVLDHLFNQYEIRLILEDIWNSFDDAEKEILTKIAQGSSLSASRIPERLIKLKIVTSKEKGVYELFSPLFLNFIAGLNKNLPELTADSKTGELLINGQPAKEKITLQEYLLLTSFLKKRNSVLSRDQIGQTLWGKMADEKYSDWAIDQVVSQLRKKLEKLGLSSGKLQTIRNRGYRWLD